MMRWYELFEDDMGKAHADINLFEMANLEPSQTGIVGTIYISTQQGRHGPRVKYFAGRPGNSQPSMVVSVGPEPLVMINDLPNRVRTKMEPIVKQWVTLNHIGLHKFWYEGNTWYKSEVDAFIAGLTKWTPNKESGI